MKKVILVATASFVLLLTAQLAQAITAYDNFGPNDSYDNGGIWFGTRTINPSMTYSGGSSFTSQAGGRLNSLTLAISDIYDRTNEAFDVSLFTDNYGTLGTQFWHQTFRTNVTYTSLFRANNLDGPTLTAGTNYWLFVSGVNLMPELNWALSNQETNGNRVLVKNGQSFSYSSGEFAMRVEVVPEPATLLLLGLGMAMVTRKQISKNI